MSKSNPKVTPIFAASTISGRAPPSGPYMQRVVASNINEKARHKRRAFPLCGVRFGRSSGFRFLVDGAFGDLGQGRIGFLFFSESLIQKPDRTAQSKLVGPGFECAVA